MTDLVDKLEARGLVRRARQKADRRAVQVELTAGRAALIEPLFARACRAISLPHGAAWTTAELRQLGGRLLRKLGAGSRERGP